LPLPSTTNDSFYRIASKDFGLSSLKKTGFYFPSFSTTRFPSIPPSPESEKVSLLISAVPNAQPLPATVCGLL
jgi:hypothetical protein